MTPDRPTSSAHPRRRWRFVALTSVLLVLSVAASLLFLLQPWASCPDDDSSAGCPVTGWQLHAQSAVFLLVPVSVALLAVAATRALRR